MGNNPQNISLKVNVDTSEIERAKALIDEINEKIKEASALLNTIASNGLQVEVKREVD